MFADENAPPSARQMVADAASFDEGKIDEAVLAILFMSAFEENGVMRAWKGINWDATNRLFEHGFISYPRTPSKSVVFTPEGASRAREAAEKLFGLGAAARPLNPGEEATTSGDAPPVDSFESTFY